MTVSTKPKILISVSANTDGNTYAGAIRSAGGEPVVAYCYQESETFDGLVLAGGGDIAPAYFGEETCGSNPPDPLRDKIEMKLCGIYTEKKIPILAICRGCQLVNVFLGGSLMQDIPNHTASCHMAENRKNSLAHRLFGNESLVNSSHHQAIKTPGKGVKITQYSKADGIIEGFEHETLPILATQWHPERMPNTMPLFEYFVNLCKKSKTR